ncbi:MAG TPA: hypothetical protein VF575_00810 [Candidatus Saccharimonadales bacterium]|jgi:hypothetical protein
MAKYLASPGAQTTVAIMPGFGEGSWHTNRLARELTTHGYRPVQDASIADIVVTHSAGCFFLPNTRHNKLLILIDPPYWPGRSNIVRICQKTWWDFVAHIRRRKVGFYLHKTAWNWVYILANIARVVKIGQLARKHNFHEALAHETVAIIRNDHDAWFMPNAAEALPTNETFTFYRLPGEHDDCWLYTREHADLIHHIILQHTRTTG